MPPERFDKLRVEPTNVPQVWLTSARFDHAAHRALDCRACHANADKSDRAGDVLLPGIKACAGCHTSADRAGRGGARHDCVECHRYHGGDDPLHGRGADIRGVPTERRMNPTEFNNGRR